MTEEGTVLRMRSDRVIGKITRNGKGDQLAVPSECSIASLISLLINLYSFVIVVKMLHHPVFFPLKSHL